MALPETRKPDRADGRVSGHFRAQGKLSIPVDYSACETNASGVAGVQA